MISEIWLVPIAILVCLLLSAFFSGSETALTASSRAGMLRLEKHAAFVENLNQLGKKRVHRRGLQS